MFIRVKNYQIIENIELEVKGITLIVGNNSNGKSSLVRAIRSACLGNLGDKFIRYGTKECSVELEFDDGKVMWSKDEKDTFFRVGDEKKEYTDKLTFSKTNKKIPEEYSKALKIGKVSISKNTELSPNFSLQFDPLFLLYLGEVELSNALSFLFSGQKFPNTLKMISGAIRDTRKDLIFIEGSISQKEKSIEDATRGLEAYIKFEKYFPLKDQLFQWHKDISDIEISIGTLSVMDKDIQESKDRVATMKKLSDRLAPLNENLLLEIEDISKELKLLEMEEKDIELCKSSIVNNGNMFKNKKEQISELALSLTKCPFCDKDIDDEERLKLAEGTHEI